jgi:hypothetical protein
MLVHIESRQYRASLDVDENNHFMSPNEGDVVDQVE